MSLKMRIQLELNIARSTQIHCFWWHLFFFGNLMDIATEITFFWTKYVPESVNLDKSEVDKSGIWI